MVILYIAHLYVIMCNDEAVIISF